MQAYPPDHEPQNPYVEKASVTICQQGDGNGSHNLQSLTVSSVEAGGGPYYVVESDRWAADSVQELYDVIAQVVGMMPQADDKIKLHGPYTPPKDAP